MDPKQRLLAVSGDLVQLQQIVLISVCVSVWGGDVWMHSQNTLLTHPVARPKPTGLLNPVLVTYYPWQLIGLINSLRMAIWASAAGTKFHTLCTLHHGWLELIGLWWMYQEYNRNKKSLIIHHCNRLQIPENKEKSNSSLCYISPAVPALTAFEVRSKCKKKYVRPWSKTLKSKNLTMSWVDTESTVFIWLEK